MSHLQPDQKVPKLFHFSQQTAEDAAAALMETNKVSSNNSGDGK